MGSIWSAVVEFCPESLTIKMSETYNRKRKKDIDDEEESMLNSLIASPKRRKLTCTAMYIYQTLYKEGRESDITVKVLDNEWKLHKVYLGQSLYFNSMFSGSWNETNKSYITIENGDPNVTSDALDAVFGSFYLDEITIEPRVVVGVLAASTMFQLEGLIEQCSEIMLETISPLTVVKYYEAAVQYGVHNVKEKIISWFAVNLTDYFAKNAVRLQAIEVDLMLTILRRSDLCIIQTEMTLYYLLRKWMCLRIFQPNEHEPNLKDHKNLGELGGGENGFLLTEAGQEYLEVFRELRVNNLLLHSQDNSVIVEDKILPESWITEGYQNNWCSLLQVSSGSDKGPNQLSPEVFLKHAVRCGRVVKEWDSRSWRWNGFGFGIDLIWSITEQGVYVQRHCSLCSSTHASQVHHIMVQVEVLNLDEQRQVKRRLKSDISKYSLAKNQEVKVLSLTDDFVFPLYISLRVIVVSPSTKSKAPNSL